MRPLDLTLNGLPADLPASTKGLLKLQQARSMLNDVAARWGLGALTLALPDTRGNARIFGAAKLHAQGRNKFGPYTDYAAVIQVDGQRFAGTFRLTSLKNGYTGTFIGDERSWAVLLSDRKLTELNFAPVPDYDGSQLAGILDLDCDSTDVQFPLVAWGNFFSPPLHEFNAAGELEEVPSPPAAWITYPLAVDDYPPGVYYVNVLRAIFRSIGWHLTGRELDADFWRAVVLTCAGADVGAAWNWGTLLKATGTAPQGSRSFSYYAQQAEGYSNNAAGFYSLPGNGPELAGDCFFLPVLLTAAPLRPTRALDLTTATYTAPRNGVYDFSWAFTLDSYTTTFAGPGVDVRRLDVMELLRPVGMGLVVCRGGKGFDEGEGGLLRGDPYSVALDYAPGQDRVLTPQRLDVPGTGYSAGTGFGSLKLGNQAGAVSGVYLEAGDSVTLAVFARRAVFDAQNELQGYRSIFVLNFSAASLACTHYADDQGLSRTDLEPARFLPPLLMVDVVKQYLLTTDSFIITDPARRVATVLTRAELSAAGGPALDLSERVDARAIEYTPLATGKLTFAPAPGPDDPLAPADTVEALISPGDSVQAIGSIFGAVGFRSTWLPRGSYVPVPTCSTADILKQNRSEVAWDISSERPRLLRYTGPDPDNVVPFGTGTVPLATSAWDGALAWDGAAGAVGTYWAATIRRMCAGHLSKFAAPLTPALFVALKAGRRVLLHGATYTTESVDSFDVADEAAPATLTLSLEIS